MTNFVGIPADLEESLSYELQALQYLRVELFNQSENTNDLVTITLGDVAENGDLKQHHSTYIYSDICSTRIQEALSKLRPLAFSAAFKMQDMIADWILRANGCVGKGDWRFQAKLANYERLSVSLSLVEPDFFASRPLVSKAFWELFRRYEPYRGTLTHAGGVSILGNGTLRITKPNLAPLELTNFEQSAYIQALCIISNELIGRIKLDIHLEAIIESALAKLAAYHGVSSIQDKYIRLSRLKVIVPKDQLASVDPLSVELDWDLLREAMRKSHLMPGMAGELFYPVTVEVQQDASVSRWDIPLEAVPTGKMTLAEGDPRFDGYWIHQPKAQEV